MIKTCKETFKTAFSTPDKEKHFIVAMILAVIFPLLAIVMSIYKEIKDNKQENNHFCYYDLLADSAGITVGSIIWWLIWMM